MIKFTFKKHIPEGRYRSFELGQTDIKVKKKVCGSISESRHHTGWKVSFQVKDSSKTHGWKWIFFKKIFETEQEARDFVTSGKVEEVLNNAGKELYFFED